MTTEGVSHFPNRHEVAGWNYDRLVAYAKGVLSDEPESLQSGADLIRTIEQFFRRFVIMPEKAYLPLTIWALATHVYETFHAFGYVSLQSPLPGCGKTRVLELLECLCARPWMVNSVTPAVLFRKIASEKPTLLLDEIEVLRGKQKSEVTQEIIGILNVGYKRGANVPRCVGKEFKVVDFPVYCAKAFGSIGGLPNTISDRSIIVHMQKLANGEKVERFTMQGIAPEAAALRERIELLMADAAEHVRSAYEALPALPFLRDRQEEIWQPLFATLSVLDCSRMAELRHCAVALTANKAADDEDGQTSLKLLADIRTVWPKGAAHVSSATLVENLRGLEESPWEEFELNARRLAKRLRPFGIQSRQVRIGSVTVKGYALDEFQPVFDCYLAPSGILSETCETTRMNIDDNDGFASET